jgi:hypothetical protein
MNNLLIRIEILVNVFASRVWLRNELSKLGLIEDGGGQSCQYDGVVLWYILKNLSPEPMLLLYNINGAGRY